MFRFKEMIGHLKRNPLALVTIFASLVALVAFGGLIYRLIIAQNTEGLGWSLALLALIFTFSASLNAVNAHASKTGSAQKFVQFLTYLYSVLVGLAYEAIVYQLLTSPRTGAKTYLGFWAILVACIVAFGVLRWISQLQDQGWLAIPIVVATLLHYTLMIIRYFLGEDTEIEGCDSLLGILECPLSQNIFLAVFMTMLSAFIYIVAERWPPSENKKGFFGVVLR